MPQPPRPEPPAAVIFTARSSPRSGAIAAAACYLLWGLVPLYWRRLASVDAVELIAHRHLWSLLILGLFLVPMQGARREAVMALRSARSVGRVLLGALLLTTNWLVYVWGVNTGHIIETSLGYFLVPLFSVLAGRVLLHEHLRRAQVIAVGFAAAGVGGMVAMAGGIPWIALALAGSWSAYSVHRKTARVGPVAGLAAESLVLAPVAIGFLAWRHHGGHGALGSLDGAGHALLLSSGMVTALPLLLFAHGARHIRLSTLGVMQYIAPTLQMAIGVVVYHEPVSRGRLACFVVIWTALVIYSIDAWRAQGIGRVVSGSAPRGA